MLFNSVVFLVFTAIVVAVYHCLTHRLQNYFLLLASYTFYGWWDYRYLVLVWVVTVLNYLVALAIQSNENQVRRKLLVSLSCVVTLGILGFFKYYDFFVSSFANFVALVGFRQSLTVLHIILPVGISFYTFQSLAYIIDVYRKKTPACTNFLTFALFSCYFPVLLAGPIERAGNLIPKIQNPRVTTADDFRRGLQLMLLGYVRKVAIADSLAPYVDECFLHYREMGGIDLILGTYLVSLQIYADFAGYSDIVRGISRLLGIELMVNFRQPYFATSIREFWRRWHISFSSWLTDYIYFPLGGNRKGKTRTYLNLMAVMLLCGLWHGAGLNYIVWGGIHGVFLCVHRLFYKKELDGRVKPLTLKIAQIIATFHLAAFGWIFFRASSLSDALGYMGRMVSSFGPVSHALLLTFLFYGPIVCLIDYPLFRHDRQYIFEGRENWLLRGSVYAASALLIFYVGEKNVAPFVYFKF